MNLLVIRLSAMGDVALVVPVLQAVLQKHPDLTITMLTRPAFVPMFQNSERLYCVAADVKNRHKGIPGLYRLYKEILHQYNPDKIIDLHDVMRSWVLCSLFRKDGIPFFRIDKGRKEKKALTRKKNKKFIRLKHSVERYLEVFERAGYPAKIAQEHYKFNSAEKPKVFLYQRQLLPKTGIWIGLAPFAKHKEKIWPLKKMKEVLQALIAKGYQLFLFGGGREELEAFEALQKEYPSLIIVAGHLSLTEELGLIKRLDLMITMDSANMHLSAISGIPVVSIWGPTHPYAGFGPLNGNEKNIVQISHEKLPCRPSSVYGNKPCECEGHACMEEISPEMVLKKINEVLEIK